MGVSGGSQKSSKPTGDDQVETEDADVMVAMEPGTRDVNNQANQASGLRLDWLVFGGVRSLISLII
jgi:hypothetical protein